MPGLILTLAAWIFCLALFFWNTAALVEFATSTGTGLRMVLLNSAYELRDQGPVVDGQIIVPSISVFLVHNTRFYQRLKSQDSLALTINPIHKVEIRDNLGFDATLTSDTSPTPLVRSAVARVKVPLNTADNLMSSTRPTSSVDSVSLSLSELLANTQDVPEPVGSGSRFFGHAAHLIVRFDRQQLNAVRACQVGSPRSPHTVPRTTRSPMPRTVH